jgi:hypothetical protein
MANPYQSRRQFSRNSNDLASVNPESADNHIAEGANQGPHTIKHDISESSTTFCAFIELLNTEDAIQIRWKSGIGG